MTVPRFGKTPSSSYSSTEAQQSDMPKLALIKFLKLIDAISGYHNLKHDQKSSLHANLVDSDISRFGRFSKQNFFVVVD